jgi:hypothetical protein
MTKFFCIIYSFVSTLVTAVLTHHLGWVATVLPGKMSLPHFSKKPCARQLVSAHFDVQSTDHVS